MAKKKSVKPNGWQPQKPEPAMRITKARRILITELADLLAAIAPATTRGNGFCVQKVAIDHGDRTLWKDESNKRKSIARYLESLFRKYPNKPKRMVLEIVQGGLQWKANRGEAVERSHLDQIGEQLTALGFSAVKELQRMDIPEPSRVATPPANLVSIIKQVPLHEALQDDCLTMFQKGHLNEAIRKALDALRRRFRTRPATTTLARA